MKTIYRQTADYGDATRAPTRSHFIDGCPVNAEVWRLSLRGWPIWLARLYVWANR